jgi:hypothetical protein
MTSYQSDPQARSSGLANQPLGLLERIHFPLPTRALLCRHGLGSQYIRHIVEPLCRCCLYQPQVILDHHPRAASAIVRIKGCISVNLNPALFWSLPLHCASVPAQWAPSARPILPTWRICTRPSPPVPRPYAYGGEHFAQSTKSMLHTST